MSESLRQSEAGDLFIGLMSGTSLDGVDAALADFSVSPPRLLASHYLVFPRKLAAEILALQERGVDELHRAASLGNTLAHCYHQAISGLLETAELSSAAIRAVGCHGQTIRHNPSDGYTLQIGNAALLAELSGLRVVADFRSRDIAAGGQGAPLVPAFHEAMFRASDRHRVVLNIGGIANLTDLRPGTATRGFDCGPGNMLLDAWIQQVSGRAFDECGTWASSGKVLASLLETLLRHPFFAEQPPKSCGRDEFGLPWLRAHLATDLAPEDVQATLLELTAHCIIQSIHRWCGRPDEVAVCGGGTHNKVLIERLRQGLPGTSLFTTDALGIGADWVEAMAFAWLARQRLMDQPGNLPAVTGARGARVLGAIYAP